MSQLQMLQRLESFLFDEVHFRASKHQQQLEKHQSPVIIFSYLEVKIKHILFTAYSLPTMTILPSTRVRRSLSRQVLSYDPAV